MQSKIFGPKVFVYFNLRKKKFSIKDLKTKLVIGYSDDLFLHEAKFKVSEAGRKRVLSSGIKNVHAGVEGYILEYKVDLPFKAKYNPYLNSSFVDKDKLAPVYSASVVRLYTHNDRAVVEYANSIDRL